MGSRGTEGYGEGAAGQRQGKAPGKAVKHNAGGGTGPFAAGKFPAMALLRSSKGRPVVGGRPLDGP